MAKLTQEQRKVIIRLTQIEKEIATLKAEKDRLLDEHKDLWKAVNEVEVLKPQSVPGARKQAERWLDSILSGLDDEIVE